ncbi:hypothetical protein SAMN06265370_104232 [Puniceibacterium sediminis]|uniref:Benzylsuccinate synthase n=1 Tax=Puniceibacterium sediminis TaxID=1608407 RepID=A0A238W7X8_9RHOB|nr:hypothetical protein SAMN06265370_104232 [Puniceibacterium sediminis]
MSGNYFESEYVMKCNECIYWDTGSLEDAGFCRRNPPELERNDAGTVLNSAVWPVTRTYDWCGEFAERVPQ